MPNNSEFDTMVIKYNTRDVPEIRSWIRKTILEGEDGTGYNTLGTEVKEFLFELYAKIK